MTCINCGAETVKNVLCQGCWRLLKIARPLLLPTREVKPARGSVTQEECHFCNVSDADRINDAAPICDDCARFIQALP